MTLTIRLICTAAALTLLGGCVEVAYKRGAGEDSLAAARNECKESGGKDYALCMEQSGWSVYQPDDPKLNLTLTANSDNRSESPKPAMHALDVSHLDANEVYQISSWWRFGGDASTLQIDAAACSKQLGSGHTLVSLAQGGYKASGAMLKCLKEKGWRGLPAG